MQKPFYRRIYEKGGIGMYLVICGAVILCIQLIIDGYINSKSLTMAAIAFLGYYIFKRYKKKQRNQKERKRQQQLKKQATIQTLKKYFGKDFNYSARSRYGPDNSDIFRLMKRNILKKCNRVGTKEDTFTYKINLYGKEIIIKGGEIHTLDIRKGGSGFFQEQNVYSDGYTASKIEHCYIINIEYNASRIEKHGKIALKSNFHKNNETKFEKFSYLIDNFKHYDIIDTTQFRDKYIEGEKTKGSSKKELKDKEFSKISFFQTEFNKLFTVKSNDQIFARYIINPAFMESLTTFAIRMKHPLDFYLENGEMYIVLHLGKNERFLEPDDESVDIAEKLKKDIMDIVRVVKDLNLLYRAKIEKK